MGGRRHRLNVAVRDADFPGELRDRAGTLGLEPELIEPTLSALLRELERWLAADSDAVLEAVRSRDALRGREVRWGGQVGTGAGSTSDGRLVVRTDAARCGSMPARSTWAAPEGVKTQQTGLSQRLSADKRLRGVAGPAAAGGLGELCTC